jgi:hypothetical protein
MPITHVSCLHAFCVMPFVAHILLYCGRYLYVLSYIPAYSVYYGAVQDWFDAYHCMSYILSS